MWKPCKTAKNRIAKKMKVQIKRIYEEPEESDGYRVLVDRLWPRGVSKEKARLDDWAKKLTPTHELRKWFDHDPEKWEEFKAAYRQELLNKEAQIGNFFKKIEDKMTVTLLYAAKDTDHTHAKVLKKHILEFLETE